MNSLAPHFVRSENQGVARTGFEPVIFRIALAGCGLSGSRTRDFLDENQAS